MIDLHCHVLPSIDDGPDTPEQALAFARAARAAGVETLVATPHVNGRYRNDSATIASGVQRLAALLAREHVPLTLLAGAEVALERALELDADELERVCLGGGRWLLLEPPFRPTAPALVPTVAELQRRGHGIVLAHPERCPAFYRDLGLLESLIRGGAVTSITASSLTGAFGGAARSFALALADAGLIHNVASDAHDASDRPPEIASHVQRAGLGGLSEWLTEDVPRAILRGNEIPTRPRVPVRAARRRWSALSRSRRKRASDRSARWPHPLH
ncbi:MAG TPA: CpsB/CapC family capsule biosynthesis tyrosine phosphatase [Solirubrobacteraceae bacterium]|nr:CpsB/CapC family capsule biosynthesis tyrosine phosphatase [Solirubrobacteraceae bacterium]